MVDVLNKIYNNISTGAYDDEVHHNVIKWKIDTLR